MQAILLCMVGELAGGGSVAVAVGVSNMLQVTSDTGHVTHDTLQATRYTRHVTPDMWYLTHDT